MAPTFESEIFDGETFEKQHDGTRLARQLTAVRAYMNDGRWHTLGEIAAAVRAPQASVSARLRDLRKDRFGARVVERRHRHARERGIFEYRLVPTEEIQK